MWLRCLAIDHCHAASDTLQTQVHNIRSKCQHGTQDESSWDLVKLETYAKSLAAIINSEFH